MSVRSPWTSHARQWSRVGPPLRPSPEDVAVARKALDAWRGATGRDDPTLLVMGVTPELCSLPTGERSRVIAVDRSADMIGSVWPGPLRPKDAVLCADWRHLPIENDSVDVLLSDGCLSTLPYPAGYADVCAELLRVLRDGGRCVARCFVQSEKPERADDVLADLVGVGPVASTPSSGGSRWRSSPTRRSVSSSRTYGTRSTRGKRLRCAVSAPRMAGRRGADDRRVPRVEARYSFPSLGSLCGLFTDAGFSVLEVSHPSYELGDRCPSLVLVPRGPRGRA